LFIYLFNAVGPEFDSCTFKKDNLTNRPITDKNEVFGVSEIAFRVKYGVCASLLFFSFLFFSFNPFLVFFFSDACERGMEEGRGRRSKGRRKERKGGEGKDGRGGRRNRPSHKVWGMLLFFRFSFAQPFRCCKRGRGGRRREGRRGKGRKRGESINREEREESRKGGKGEEEKEETKARQGKR
jgi:hypothetical protein